MIERAALGEMMKAVTTSVWRTLGLAAVLLLAACGGEDDPIGVAGNGSIRGTVTDDGGNPVADASIHLSGNGQAGRTTSAGADGVFTFADVPAGTYALTITPPTGFTLGAAGTISITVASEVEAQAAAFVLQPVIAPGSIRGTVFDSSGAVVANIAVELSGNGGANRTAMSGVDGVYNFANVPPGAYTLTIKPPPAFAIGGPATAEVAVVSGVQANVVEFVLNARTPDEAFVAALQAQLEAATAADQFSGAVLVVRDGVTLFEGAYGRADREQNIPNSPDTRFRAGSMHKMLTAVSVLQLVQQGQVSLNATLDTYLPDYPNVELASKVTIHHLLTHTGGTGNIFGPLFDQHRLDLREVDDYLELYGERDLLFKPGEQWQYSNYGFVLLGAVIERVTGMRYDDYVAANVLAPAGMTGTGAAPEDSVVPGRAVSYAPQSGSFVSVASTLPYRGTPAGGGYSTVRDFERFATAIREHKLLDAAHTELLYTGKVAIPQNPDLYAYGFVDRVVAGRRLVGHTGGAAGMAGYLDFEPDGGYTVVVLSNFSWPAATPVTTFILGTLPDE